MEEVTTEIFDALLLPKIVADTYYTNDDFHQIPRAPHRNEQSTANTA